MGAEMERELGRSGSILIGIFEQNKERNINSGKIVDQRA
jgi:hypothetical protein